MLGVYCWPCACTAWLCYAVLCRHCCVRLVLPCIACIGVHCVLLCSCTVASQDGAGDNDNEESCASHRLGKGRDGGAQATRRSKRQRSKNKNKTKKRKTKRVRSTKCEAATTAVPCILRGTTGRPRALTTEATVHECVLVQRRDGGARTLGLTPCLVRQTQAVAEPREGRAIQLSWRHIF